MCLCPVLGTWDRTSSCAGRDGTKLQLRLTEAVGRVWFGSSLSREGLRSRDQRPVGDLGFALGPCALSALPRCPPGVLVQNPFWRESRALVSETGGMDTDTHKKII